MHVSSSICCVATQHMTLAAFTLPTSATAAGCIVAAALPKMVASHIYWVGVLVYITRVRCWCSSGKLAVRLLSSVVTIFFWFGVKQPLDSQQPARSTETTLGLTERQFPSQRQQQHQ
jgi:hypothetical protein